MKYIKMLLSRRTLVILLLILQLWFAVYLIWHASVRYNVAGMLFNIFSIIVVMYIVNRTDNESFKLSWVVFVLTAPFVGGALYFMFRLQSSAHGVRKRMRNCQRFTREALKQDEEVRREVAMISPAWVDQINYLIDVPGYPVYNQTETKFLSDGREYFNQLLAAVKTAERYIFIEIFIIRRGWMWDTLESALVERANVGIDVRLIYDDMGCFMSLPNNFDKKMRARGIKCVKFNPFRPFWSTLQNNRDHRKIISIDGKIAFTGGINFADEYVDKVRRFGHWKDAGIMLCGEGAWTFAVLFLEMWNAVTSSYEDIVFFKPDLDHHRNAWRNIPQNRQPEQKQAEHGYVQPYADSPIDNENTGEYVYRRIISNARKYIYITTPYLILDHTLISSLELSAKCGVDIRIITPAVPDKKLVYLTTRSYYKQLLHAGVRIYEYTPGFIHSKIFVSDDVTATVGTANFDFRSLYLNFECGVLLHRSPAVDIIKRDFLETLEKCREITPSDCRTNLFIRAVQMFMRFAAPLM